LATASRCGIGFDVSKIRAIGSPVNGGSIVHTGIIPFLKIYESCVKAWCQNSTRGGCFEQDTELPVLDSVEIDGKIYGLDDKILIDNKEVIVRDIIIKNGTNILQK